MRKSKLATKIRTLEKVLARGPNRPIAGPLRELIKELKDWLDRM